MEFIPSSGFGPVTRTRAIPTRYLPYRMGAFQNPEFREVLGRFDGRSDKGIQQHAAHITPHIHYMIDHIMKQCPATDPKLSMFLESMIRLLLLEYVKDKPVDGSTLAHSGEQLMEDIAAYITAHPEYPHTIALLAKEFATNTTALKRQFKAYTGQTIAAFIYEVRMKQATELLHTTSLPIRDIAMQTGYYELSNFDRAFRRKFGHPPHYYRS